MKREEATRLAEQGLAELDRLRLSPLEPTPCLAVLAPHLAVIASP